MEARGARQLEAKGGLAHLGLYLSEQVCEILLSIERTAYGVAQIFSRDSQPHIAVPHPTIHRP